MIGFAWFVEGNIRALIGRRRAKAGIPPRPVQPYHTHWGSTRPARYGDPEFRPDIAAAQAEWDSLFGTHRQRREVAATLREWDKINRR